MILSSQKNQLFLHIEYKCATWCAPNSRYNMSISKTRQKLVDVARQLFAKNGLAGTTMNDIAVASGKGRRTLYTYFNRKEDVYYAVIESELERLSDKLDEVAAKKIRPQDKIVEPQRQPACRVFPQYLDSREGAQEFRRGRDRAFPKSLC